MMASTGEIYSPHLQHKQMSEEIKTGKLFKGRFMPALHNPRNEANVNVNGLTSDVLVQGWKNMNRAMLGDEVCIEILDQQHWKSSEASGLE